MKTKTGDLWNRVHAMDEAELMAFAESHMLDMTDQTFDDLEGAADYICAQLEIDNRAESEESDAEDNENYSVVTADHAEEPEAVRASDEHHGTEIDEAAQAYLEAHPNASYSEALTAVLRKDPLLAARYRMSFTRGISASKKLARRRNGQAAMDLNHAAHKLLEEEPAKFKTYEEAQAHVLDTNSTLARRYREWLES